MAMASKTSPLPTGHFDSRQQCRSCWAMARAISAPHKLRSLAFGPFSVAVGDFNGDGKQDLAVANQGSDNVSILLGDGTGNFSAPTNFAAGNGPCSVAVGDFNGDGKQDLAVANVARTTCRSCWAMARVISALPQTSLLAMPLSQ